MSESSTEKIITDVASKVVKPKLSTMRKTSNRASPKISPSPSKDDDKPVPHYLRPSTGSCHDFCKYGIKHTPEPKKLNPAFRKNMVKKEKPNEEQKQAADVIIRADKKKTENKQRTKELARPTEKLILDSLIKLKEHSAQESSSLNIASPSQINSLSFDNSFVNQAEELLDNVRSVNSIDMLKGNASNESESDDIFEGSVSEPVLLIIEANDLQNSLGYTEVTAEAKVEGYFWVPLNENIKESIPEDLHRKVGEEVSSNKLIGNRPKIPEVSAVAPANGKLKMNTSTASTKGCSVKRADKASNESPSKNLKTPDSTDSSSPSSMKTPIEQIKCSSGEQYQEMSSIANYKTKREATILKVAEKQTVASACKAKGVRKECIDIIARSSSVEETVGERKTTKSAKLDSRQKNPLSKNVVASVTPKVTMKKAASLLKKNNASVTHMVIRKQTSITPETNDESIKPAISSKLTDNSVSISTPLGKLHDQKNKKKIICLKDKQSVSAPQSSKPHLTTAPSFRLSKHRNISPALSANNLSKASKFGQKDMSSSFSHLKVKNTDMKITKQNLCKLGPYSFDRNKRLETSVSKWNQVRKCFLRKEVIERKFSIVIKGEIKRRHRRTASSLSLDRPLTPRKLTFSRGKTINFEPKDNTPVKLKFKQPTKMLNNSQNRRSLFGPPEAHTVVLKHQDLQDNKKAQGLFNNVIEETARKLVKVKKSKVKALVGAFETVISLQDSKAPVVVVL